MDKLSHKREKCRLCESKNLKLVVKLEPTPIGDDYVSSDQFDKKQVTFPVELFLCLDCGLAQLLEILNSKNIYVNYIYKTSDSLGLVEHFRSSVEIIMKKVEPKENSFVIDIGSNDGTYLQFYKEKGMRALGVEPAKSIAQNAINTGIETLPKFFNSKTAKSINEKYGKATIISANNVFANIDELIDMIKGVQMLLLDDGVFVLETGYVLDLLNKTIFDNIYHEHLSYFSVKPLKKFFENNGLELIDVERLAPKGGSIRCIAQKKGGKRTVSEYVKEVIDLEDENKLHEPQIFLDFADRLKDLKKKIQEIVGKIKDEGKTVAGYGASVGVTTALYNFGLDTGNLSFLVDDNKNRQGLYSPGLHVPVKPPAELMRKEVDYTIILAWMYNKPILERNSEYLNKGGKFIKILPEFKTIEVGQE
ncbi:class I SAM-dependent methyltransferase [Candidatus Woesearchaeota archaeon]|nr:class I SAM-dependent methyltransferase [Candidatus Woesearchaeota archaeon]